MKDKCANLGTMCASTIVPGSHGILRLHVWVDLIVFFLLCNAILIGNFTGCLLTSGVPFKRKRPVVLESENIH